MAPSTLHCRISLKSLMALVLTSVLDLKPLLSMVFCCTSEHQNDLCCLTPSMAPPNAFRTLPARVLSACNFLNVHYGSLEAVLDFFLLMWDELTLELRTHTSTSLSMWGTPLLPYPWCTGSAIAASMIVRPEIDAWQDMMLCIAKPMTVFAT